MSKTYVIGDLHGQFDLMQQALAEIERSRHSGGTVVFLGDYVDRGPQSKQVVERLMQGPPAGWRWVCLKGNHEDMMAETIGGPDEGWWLGNGGDATVASYGGDIPREHLEWCRSLPMMHQDKHRVYVHAGVEPSRPLTEMEQGESVLLWMRYPENCDVECDKHVVHGHTPFRDGPVLMAGRTNLDTGAVFFGRLVVGVFDDDKPGGPAGLITIRSLTKGKGEGE